MVILFPFGRRNGGGGGGEKFCLKYHRLFAISNQKDVMVADIRVGGDSISEWNFIWRRMLFVWEEDLLNNMLSELQGVELSHGEVMSR